MMNEFDESDGGAWLDRIDELLALALDVSYQYPRAGGFCLNVTGTLRDFQRKIKRYGLPTPRQMRAIKNIEAGLRRWNLK